MWTQFMDMHSGGGIKEEPYAYIYIEAPEDEAKVIFYNRFEHNPERVSCTCCGSDYSISENESLAQLTAYDRGCEYDKTMQIWVEQPRGRQKVISLEDYFAREDVLIISSKDIAPADRIGEVPEQGYVWVD